MTTKNLRTVLDHSRHMRRLTLQEMAKEIGLELTTLCRFERGKEVEVETLLKILSWLLK